MKAVVYRGPRDVSVENVPDPKIERPTDVIVQIRSTNICGSDLHMFEGRTDFETGRVFGHENLGQITEVGERAILGAGVTDRFTYTVESFTPVDAILNLVMRPVKSNAVCHDIPGGLNVARQVV